jgi:hypothetical protein
MTLPNLDVAVSCCRQSRIQSVLEGRKKKEKKKKTEQTHIILKRSSLSAADIYSRLSRNRTQSRRWLAFHWREPTKQREQKEQTFADSRYENKR